MIAIALLKRKKEALLQDESQLDAFENVFRAELIATTK